ncbi:MAG: uracil-DNA glycosylase family protein, partial [Pseudomonadota bacterium]
MSRSLDEIVAGIRACTLCVDDLPHAPVPIVQAGAGARIGIFSQAPGNRAHQSGKPFYDPSGVRLRDWLQVSEAEFYDPDRFVIAPMGFCFPGYDAKGGDLPPLKRCAE